MNRRDNHIVRSPRTQEASEPGTPIVTPALVEHLREHFPPVELSEVDGAGGVDAAVQLAVHIERSKAQQAVLAYLQSLVKNPEEDAA